MPNAQQRPTPMSWRRSLCSCSLLSSAWFLTMRRWAMGERPASVIKKGSRKLTHTISIAVFSISNYAIHTMYGMYTYIPGILYIYIYLFTHYESSTLGSRFSAAAIRSCPCHERCVTLFSKRQSWRHASWGLKLGDQLQCFNWSCPVGPVP